MTGIPEVAAAQGDIDQQFVQMGLDVTIEPFSTQNWSHERESPKVLGPLKEDVAVTTYGASYSIWGTYNGKP